MHPIWFSINYPSCAFYVLRNPDQLFGIKPFLIFFQTWYLWFLCNHTWQRISGFACRFCVILLTSKPTQNVRALNFLCKMLVSYHYKLSFEDWNFPPFAPFNKDKKCFFLFESNIKTLFRNFWSAILKGQLLLVVYAFCFSKWGYIRSLIIYMNQKEQRQYAFYVIAYLEHWMKTHFSRPHYTINQMI